ncbi:FAS1 domain-containing protein [Lentinula raphanica]|nr:FAS1 domain-containing protein [Lentinula raphanica]KAJ3966485.1 FAS1 domain-containing protein [Lentinula raphanica]
MLFTSLALLASLNFSLAAQVILSSSNASITSSTIIDALSNDSDYHSLLQLIQRARLVPVLNRLNGSTLFAPTNDAIEHHSLWKSVLMDSNELLYENVQEQLRQQLFYHLLNETIPPEVDSLTVFKTLHYPHSYSDSPSNEPPPHPPWMPIPNGTLGQEPQRLRLGKRKDDGYVGVDAFCNGGAKVVKGQVDAGNGVVLGIAEVLEPPPDLATVLSQHPSLSFFRKVLTPEIKKVLNSTSELTLFLPVDEAWDALDHYERIYLESKYATEDLLRIVNMHAVVQNGVKWADSFEPAINLTTIDGTKLEIVVQPERTTVSTADLIQPDIYASNGVLHLISSLLIPDDALQITPEKYLLALNCSNFVSLIHDTELTYLINDTSSISTILAPSDDVLSILADGELPKPGSEEMKKLLQYHFIPGNLNLKKLHTGMLIETALEEPGLGGNPQVMRVEVDETQQEEAWKWVRFGGAKVLREPVKVNNTQIYFISRPIPPPSDALETVLPMLDYSMFIAAVLSTSIGDKIRNAASTSLLIPVNSAFDRLGLLVSEYLLASSSKTDLENVLLHHVLSSVRYSETLANGTQRTFASAEGSDLSVSREKNGTVFVSASGGWDGMKSQLHTRNILTQTGVVHELSDVLIPRSVDLTVGKLMKAARGSTMVSLVTKAGLDWVLNGTAPPEDSQWAEQGFGKAGWVLLCPHDNAFGQYNLTELYADNQKLVSIVSQHLIPLPAQHNELIVTPLHDDPLYNNRPLLLDDSVTYSTLQSASSVHGDLVFKQSDDAKGGYIVGIKGARGTDKQTDWANVISWGRTTTTGGGGVIRIDRLMMPYYPSWWSEYGLPIVVGVLGIFAIGGFFYGVRLIWRIDTTEATYEPASTDDDD